MSPASWNSRPREVNPMPAACHNSHQNHQAADRAARADAVAPGWPVRRILVPFDYSQGSRLAFRYAAAVARQFGASLTLLHVDAITWRDADMQNIPLMLSPAAWAEKTVRELMAIGRKELRWAFLGELNGEAVARRGEPAEEIVAAAAEMHADLIVMATHGHGGFRRRLLGGVTERVVHSAPCPVCAIPAKDVASCPLDQSGRPIWSNVVVPVDFSECSRRAARLAATVAAQTGGNLTLFHVLDRAEARLTHPLLPHKVTQATRRAEAVARLVDWARKEALPEVPVIPVVRDGVPSAESLIRGLRWMKSELVVMGTHDYSWWKRLMEGETTGQLVRHAPCPVLSLRESIELDFSEPC